MPDVSVVIPTTGRASLRATLEALAGQQQPPPFEVIIGVDGGRTPFPDDVLRHPACSRVAVVRLPERHGVSAARNAAIGSSGGALLGFLDDDVLPGAGWLKALTEGLGACAALAGRIVEDTRPGALSRLRGLAFDNRDRVNRARGGSVDYVNGGNFAVRAELLARIGVFDTAYPKSQDRELARRIVRGGATIAYAPEMVVHHRSEYTVRDLVRGRYRAGLAASAMAAGGDSTSVGPRSAVETYGANLLGLTLRHGPLMSGAAALSLVAHRAGRLGGREAAMAGKSYSRVR